MKSLNSIVYTRKIVFILMIMTLISCGDIFSYSKKITDKYYLIETETKNDFAIYYKTNDGDFIGRIPSPILEYGFNDSFLIAKCKKNYSVQYYVVNRNKDSDYADQKDFLIGNPITEKEFIEKWQERLKINFSKTP